MRVSQGVRLDSPQSLHCKLPTQGEAWYKAKSMLQEPRLSTWLERVPARGSTLMQASHDRFESPTEFRPTRSHKHVSWLPVAHTRVCQDDTPTTNWMLESHIHTTSPVAWRSGSVHSVVARAPASRQGSGCVETAEWWTEWLQRRLTLAEQAKQLQASQDSRPGQHVVS